MRRRNVSLINSARAKHRWAKDQNDRLSRALELGPCRIIDPLPVFEIATRCFITGRMNYLKIIKDMSSKRGKYAVYLNGERWRNGWSVTRFSKWMADQVCKVLDCEEINIEQ